MKHAVIQVLESSRGTMQLCCFDVVANKTYETACVAVVLDVELATRGTIRAAMLDALANGVSVWPYSREAPCYDPDEDYKALLEFCEVIAELNSGDLATGLTVWYGSMHDVGRAAFGAQIQDVPHGLK